jgi:hypothetical protein
MPVPFACPVRLTDDERQRLESLARAHSTPQALAFPERPVLGCFLFSQSLDLPCVVLLT